MYLLNLPGSGHNVNNFFGFINDLYPVSSSNSLEALSTGFSPLSTQPLGNS